MHQQLTMRHEDGTVYIPETYTPNSSSWTVCRNPETGRLSKFPNHTLTAIDPPRLTTTEEIDALGEAAGVFLASPYRDSETTFPAKTVAFYHKSGGGWFNRWLDEYDPDELARMQPYLWCPGYENTEAKP